MINLNKPRGKDSAWLEDHVPVPAVPREKPVYVLNAGQQNAHDWLVQFCLGETEYRRAVLVGYAGTGKTFTINRVVETVREQKGYINFGMTAPTHKAVRVLKKHSELKDTLDFGTIHSFLALKETYTDDGKVQYKPDFNPEYQRRIDSVQVLIADESSMLQDDLFGYLEDEMRSNSGLRIIYMGDALQIPPVGKKQLTGEANAIPFLEVRRKAHKIHLLELTEPQRQAKESPIIMYAHTIREHYLKQDIPFVFREEDKHALELYSVSAGVKDGITPLDRVREIFKQYFLTPEFQADPDYVKIVAWRNDTVHYFNRQVRLLLYNTTELPKIIEGEKLVMNAPVLGKKNTILIANNEEVVVKSVSVQETPIKYRYKAPTSAFEGMVHASETEIKMFHCKVYKTILKTPEGDEHSVHILHEDSEREYAMIRTKLEQAAKETHDQFTRKEMWKEFFGVERQFAWVTYNYCLTAHKAQGSTYNFCISMEWDINENWDIEERNRIKYVAATRAKEKLFIIRQ